MRCFASVLLCAIAVLQGSLVQAGMTVSIDPAQLSAISGTTHSLDFLLIYDQQNDSSIGSIAVDATIDQTNGQVGFLANSDSGSPMGFEFASVTTFDPVTSYAQVDVANLSIPDLDLTSVPSTVMTTVDLEIPSGVTGDFEISLVLIAAQRGSDLLDDVIVSGPTTLNVTAVPEPSSTSLIALTLAGGAWTLRRRKQKKE